MKVITVTNEKGGVGKTTTALAIGEAMRRRGSRILYIDLDPQGNMSYTLGVEGGALETLLQPENVSQYIHHTDRGDVLASAEGLARADAILTDAGREYLVADALQIISKEYDGIIIDTPPSLGILTINALTASNGCVIPVQADLYSLQGLTQVARTIGKVRKHSNAALEVYGILITRYNGRTVVRRDIAAVLDGYAQQLQTKVFTSRIRENTSIIEAQVRKTDIYSYAPRSNGAKDYTAFTDELLGGLE